MGEPSHLDRGEERARIDFLSACPMAQDAEAFASIVLAVLVI